MPPGFLQMAGGYYMIESGSCGGGLVSTVSECDAAATALGLSDQTALDYTSSTSPYYPPGCQFDRNPFASPLYVRGGGSSGSCSSYSQCICMFTPPSPPPPSPSPPPSSPPPPSPSPPTQDEEEEEDECSKANEGSPCGTANSGKTCQCTGRGGARTLLFGARPRTSCLCAA